MRIVDMEKYKIWFIFLVILTIVFSPLFLHEFYYESYVELNLMPIFPSIDKLADKHQFAQILKYTWFNVLVGAPLLVLMSIIFRVLSDIEQDAMLMFVYLFLSVVIGSIFYIGIDVFSDEMSGMAARIYRGSVGGALFIILVLLSCFVFSAASIFESVFSYVKKK